MNDNELERDLRSQRGPREGSYTPAVLPMTLDGAPGPTAKPSRLGRAGLLVGVGAAGALAVAAAAAILAGPGAGPEVGAGSESPSAEATAALAGDCGTLDVAFTAEPWGGAAGSRGTVVFMSLAAGRYACHLTVPIVATITDAGGTVLVSGGTASVGGSVELVPGARFQLGIRWSNWSGADVAEPVTLSLAATGWASPVAVDVPSGGIGRPPCSGTAEVTSLSLTELEAAP